MDSTYSYPVEFGCPYVPKWNFWPVFQLGAIIEIWFSKQNFKIAYVLALPEDICEIQMKFMIHILKALDISKVLKNARKNWNNHKSYCTLLDNFGQKYPKTDTVLYGIE